MAAINELSELAALVGRGTSARAELIGLIDKIVAGSGSYDKEIVANCLSALEAGGLLDEPRIREKAVGDSVWLSSPVGLWLAAMLLDSSGGGEAGDRSLGPGHR